MSRSPLQILSNSNSENSGRSGQCCIAEATPHVVGQAVPFELLEPCGMKLPLYAHNLVQHSGGVISWTFWVVVRSQMQH